MFKGLRIIPLLLALMFWSATPSRAIVNQPLTVKIMTLNLHNGKDPWQRPNFSRLSRLIAAEQPDIIALQEVQRPHLKYLQVPGYRAISGPNANYAFFRFGNALLTRHRILYHRHHYLPSQKEQRGVDEVAIELNGQVLRVLNTHLGLGWQEQQRQINELSRITNYLTGPVMLTGDFNLEPTNRLLTGFTFQEVGVASGNRYKTFPAARPAYQIDQIWYSRHFSLLAAQPVAWDGSDHLPVIATLKVANPEPLPSPTKPPAIPDPTLTHSPLLPDVGVHPRRFELALTATKSSATAQPGLLLEFPVQKQFLIKANLSSDQPLLAVTVLKTIDWRDYFSLAGMRGKTEWGLSAVSNLKGEAWLEWSQYYRLSDRWGSKLIVSSGDQEPTLALEQSFLPTATTRLTLRADTAARFELGVAYAPQRRQVWELKYQKDDTTQQYSIGWEYRFG